MSSPDSPATAQIRIPSRNLSIKLEALDLQVQSGPDAGKQVTLCLPTLRIGTAPDNDLVISDRTVSRHHLELRLTPEGLLLKDLGSTNGTFIGDLRVTETVLAQETECTLGYTQIHISQRTEERPVSVRQQDSLGSLVGGSEPMRELYGLIRAVASTPATVMIRGQSGAGKEMVARTIHELSNRSGPLVVFDASTADKEMMRSDLFGHVKGAFTGAVGARDGAFRRAHGGTLFIDEIGELPLDLQPRLLRVLETREVTPVGSDKPARVDVRVICATHQNLEGMVQAGEFRSDLFYRLAVVPLQVPALREIREDIPLLVKHFIRALNLECRMSEAAMQALKDYDWPGNVRELRNVLERTAVLCPDREIQPKDLRLSDAAVMPPASATTQPVNPPESTAPGLGDGSSASLAQLKEMERQMILDAMARNNNNKAAVARELEIPLSTLKRRLKEYQNDGDDDD